MKNLETVENCSVRERETGTVVYLSRCPALQLAMCMHTISCTCLSLGPLHPVEASGVLTEGVYEVIQLL